MIDEDESAQAEAQPRAHETPAQAIERWYAKHYHAAVREGRAPISAAEKADLIATVSAAISPAKE